MLINLATKEGEQYIEMKDKCRRHQSFPSLSQYCNLDNEEDGYGTVHM